MEDINKMTAKQYLGQINALKKEISRRRRELKEARELAESVGGFDYSAEVVKSSKTGDALERKVLKVVELTEEIENNINGCLNIQKRITAEIEQVQNETLKELLFMRYVEGLRLETIADRLNYSYSRTKHMHGIALLEFDKLRRGGNDTKNM